MRPRISLPDLGFLRLNAPWLGAAALLTLMSSFGQTFFISVFAGEIRASYGLSHGAWGGLYTIATAASAALMVFVGGLTDRFRARALGVGVLAGLALACAVMAVAGSVAGLVAAIFLLRFFGQGMCGQVATVGVARWFAASRGKALAVATLGVALGEALLPVTFVAAKDLADWRTLWLVAACVPLLAIPLLLVLLRQERTPQSLAQQEGSAGLERRDWTRAEVLRHWMFWLMVPSVLGPAAFNTAFFFHQVHYAASIGWEHIALAALLPVFPLTGMASMFASGWAADRFGVGAVAAAYMFPVGAGFLALANGAGSVALGLALCGLTQGMTSTVMGAFWAEYYGTRHLGAIRAMIAAFMVLGTAIGPGLTGVLIDAGLPLRQQLYGVAAYFLVSGGMAALAVMRARPALRMARAHEITPPAGRPGPLA